MSLCFTRQHWNISTHFEEKLNIDLTLSIIDLLGKKYSVKLANAQVHINTSMQNRARCVVMLNLEAWD